MKPILFEKTAANYSSNGLGKLDAITCLVTEERNGQYDLELTMSMDDIHYKDVQERRLILASHDESGDLQPFRIVKITKNFDGTATIVANHISYDLNGQTVRPFTAVSFPDALNKINANSVLSNGYTYWTDKTTSGSFVLEKPMKIRSLLGGTSGSLLDVYGTAEYEFDNKTVKAHASRGTQKNVVIKYGKNLVDLSEEIDSSNMYSAVLPYWAGTDDVVVGSTTYSAGYDATDPVLIPLDCSTAFSEKPTISQLNTYAASYLASNTPYVLKDGFDIEWVQLWDTEEYRNVAREMVGLCDIVTVIHPKMGIEISAKITKVVWNVVAEKWESMTLGDTTSSLSSTLAQNDAASERERLQQTSFFEQAIGRATAAITGNKGGYVRFNYDADGNPYEILIMDKPDIAQAVKVWRWNKSGLGYSSSGYNGPYGTAITANGEIVADYVTTGTLRAINLVGNAITGGSISGVTISGNTISGNTISGGTVSGTTISGSRIESITSAKHVDIENGVINIYNAADHNVKTVVESGTIDATYPPPHYTADWAFASQIRVHSADGSRTVYMGPGGLYTNEFILAVKGVQGTAVVKSKSFENLSDKRAKHDIEPISDAYAKSAGAIDLKRFKYNGADKENVGIIAQDLLDQLESNGIEFDSQSIISTFKDGEEELYSVNYTQFLIARLAYDESIINNLTARLDELERRLNEN